MIPIRFQFKVYPNAPKASKKARLLGVLLSVPYRAVYSFFFAAIVGFALGGEETAYLIAFALLIPFNILLSLLKKKLEKSIDAMALEEMLKARKG